MTQTDVTHGVLGRICADKLRHVAEQKRMVSPALLAERAERTRDAAAPGRFTAALKAGAAARGFGVIAEIKKASPSKGVLRERFDPRALAEGYARAGADAISVLTDTPYFMGEDAHLKHAREGAPATPALRKDFMLDPYQIDEAAALGAECVLLIAAALDDGTAAVLLQRARALKMAALAEIHDAAELDRVLAWPDAPDLIGVNNRCLKTLTVSLDVSERLLPRIPASVLRVGESGISGKEDALRLQAAGADAFLIGERFMRAEDPGAALAAFLA